MLSPVPEDDGPLVVGVAEEDFNGEWLQELIAAALIYGISKRELFEDYYFDEVAAVLGKCAELRGVGNGRHNAAPAAGCRHVGAGEFFDIS